MGLVLLNFRMPVFVGASPPCACVCVGRTSAEATCLPCLTCEETGVCTLRGVCLCVCVYSQASLRTSSPDRSQLCILTPTLLTPPPTTTTHSCCRQQTSDQPAALEGVASETGFQTRSSDTDSSRDPGMLQMWRISPGPYKHTDSLMIRASLPEYEMITLCQQRSADLNRT